MKKWRCKVCGFVFTGDNAPDECPQCHAKNAFVEVTEEKAGWACEHEVGSAKNLDPEIVQGLKDNFNSECSEVGMYLAMSRQADREGYPEIAEAFKRYAFEEADHASRFAELLGDVLTNSTKKNLELRAAAEAGAVGDLQPPVIRKVDPQIVADHRLDHRIVRRQEHVARIVRHVFFDGT